MENKEKVFNIMNYQPKVKDDLLKIWQDTSQYPKVEIVNFYDDTPFSNWDIHESFEFSIPD